ncbi:hypothetical protein [Natrialba hulunbeirensis]|uniref:hypothetical protein n=1 Tax=Natrialba hulunbeirensis TaxID=123783 RepID=UPI00135F1BD0|nr:hypothetical protein [Natrialba hulunbeirensis]
MFAVESAVEPFDDSVHVGIELDGLITPGDVGEITPGVVGGAVVTVGLVVGVTVAVVMTGTMTIPRPRIVSATVSASSVVPCRTSRMVWQASLSTLAASADTVHTTVRSGWE